MILDFFKYHGTGNDFIMVDNRENKFLLNSKNIEFLCDRHFGIGADGLIILENSKNNDFKMLYYNSDGKEGTMCGNGGRCIVAFANKLGIIDDKTTFSAIDGEHTANIKDGVVSLKMQDLKKIKKVDNCFILDTGSPHFVKFVDNLNDIDIFNKGREIRYSNIVGKDGANVNFAEIYDDIIKVGTYERGVENETLSCGTGVTAVAISAYLKSEIKSSSINIKTKGGKLNVRFKENNNIFTDIYLSGPAQFVYKGKIEIN